MKKFLVVCAASLLFCLHGTAQEYVRVAEADNAGTGVGLSVIPRLDLNFDGDFTFGDSSLYSLFEGDITPWLSFSVCNHWASFGLNDSGKLDTDAIKTLYKNTGICDDVNWVDWAYATVSFGNFGLSLGKQSMTFGGFEFDAYDFESYSFLNSTLWNNLQVYQWGAKLEWANEDENTTLSLQMTTSPFEHRPLENKLFNYALEWRGEYGNFSNIWSVNATQSAPGEYIPLVSLGQRYALDDNFTVGLDAYNAVGDEMEALAKGYTVIPSIIFSPKENFQITARIGGEYATETNNKDLVIGLDGHWFPTESLRLHFATGYRHDDNLFAATIGAVYYLNFSLK